MVVLESSLSRASNLRMSTYRHGDWQNGGVVRRTFQCRNARCEYWSSGATVNMVRVTLQICAHFRHFLSFSEPFSFGGINASKYGDVDITGDGAIEFFTYRKKVTTKWSKPLQQTWLN